MTKHNALVCVDGDRCRHIWGSCDCVVCTSKREEMIERGDAMLVDHLLELLDAPDEPDQETLATFTGDRP